MTLRPSYSPHSLCETELHGLEYVFFSLQLLQQNEAFHLGPSRFQSQQEFRPSTFVTPSSHSDVQKRLVEIDAAFVLQASSTF